MTCSARAELIVETTSGWDGSRGVGNLAPGQVWGQTFTAPSGALELTACSVWVSAYPIDSSQLGSYDLGITAYLMPWTGSRAAQPIVTSSHSSGIASPFGMTRIDFDFQDTSIVSGSEYVVFFKVDPSTAIRYVLFGYVGDGLYDGGDFGAPYAASFSTVTTRNWTIGPDDDLAFELKFTSVPELPSLAMVGIGMLFFVVPVMASRSYSTQ